MKKSTKTPKICLPLVAHLLNLKFQTFQGYRKSSWFVEIFAYLTILSYIPLSINISTHFSISTTTCFSEKRFGLTIFMTEAQVKRYTFLGPCPTVLQVALILGLKMVIVIQSVILQDACTTDTIALGQTSKWDLAEETIT